MSPTPELLLERLRVATAGEYEIERQIGAGGMATVFLARDVALDRPVAIKVMRPELIDVERVQDRFVIEARTAAKLGHPGIVTVYAIRQGAGMLYIVMRYVEGRTVDDVLRERPVLEPPTAAAIAARVADALHFAHGKGVVHRDVKPSNIIIDASGEPVVTDFGIARVSASQGLTMAGSMLGTPLYMSPEQCRGVGVTAASDQYSLGVMTYQMLAGRTPFSGEFLELIEAHKYVAPTPLGEIVVGIDPTLAETVMRMLAKDPAERWGSLADVSRRLMMTSASPRELEQMQATRSFFAAVRENLTPTPSVESLESTPLPTRVEELPPTPPPGVEARSDTGPEVIAPEVVSSVTPVDHLYDNGPRRRGPGRALVGGAVLLAIAMITFTAIWSQQGTNRGPTVIPADAPATRDTLASNPIVTPASSSPRDSAVDSAKVAKADSSPSPIDKKPPKVVAPVKGRGDSLAVECARLLERVSLGEKLTEAEQSMLTGRCRR